MKYNLFIFDFDGTLADTRKNIANSINHSLKKYKLDPLKNDEIYPLIGKLSIEDTFKKFYPSLDMQSVERIVSEFRAYQKNHIKEDLKFFPYALKALRKLDYHKKKLAILTTKNAKQMNYILTLFNIQSLFSVVYGNGLPWGDKPSRSCVEYIWSILDYSITPSKTLMIGDSVVDILAAKNAKIDIAAVTHGVDSRETLMQNEATYLINSLNQLISD